MSGDFETLEINQPKITYLKPEDNTEWLDKLINSIEEMKNKISKDSQKFKKENFLLVLLLVALNSICTFFFTFEKALTDRERAT